MNTPQFDLGAMLSAPAQTAVQHIPCDQLHPYHNHKFEMYTGERLEDMIESIRENGVLSPIIVQPIDNGYEILIGHNRWNASKLAGLPTVPAIVKTGLSDDEAEMYVIESNVIQRNFDDLRISEQAAVIALRHSKMFSQGKRNDILRELTMLENSETDISTLTPLESKLDSGKAIGAEYGLSKGSVIRLIRIDKLIDELKAFVDSGDVSIRAGVELSFLSAEAQSEIAEQAQDFKIDMKKAKLLREAADGEGNINRDTIIRIITGVVEIKPKPKSVKISNDTYRKYFGEETKAKEISETIEKALQFYFANISVDE
ncbi:MAG: ParB/RepB/Spo0J family partition protein [Ruminococcus sp.]|nr:ParB/RepB/Spo0J family partition protein [Ruminococcus sp.]